MINIWLIHILLLLTQWLCGSVNRSFDNVRIKPKRDMDLEKEMIAYKYLNILYIIQQ